jgi:transposase-like protein
MTQKRRQHSPAFEFQVALVASKGLKTTNRLSQEYNMHPNQISVWKKQLKEQGLGLADQHEESSVRRQCELVGLNRSMGHASWQRYRT